jgi:hypothetical protein
LFAVFKQERFLWLPLKFFYVSSFFFLVWEKRWKWWWWEQQRKRTSSAETIISFTKQKIFDNKLLFILMKKIEKICQEWNENFLRNFFSSTTKSLIRSKSLYFFFLGVSHKLLSKRHVKWNQKNVNFSSSEKLLAAIFRNFFIPFFLGFFFI